MATTYWQDSPSTTTPLSAANLNAREDSIVGRAYGTSFYDAGEVVATRPGLAASSTFSSGATNFASNLQSVHVAIRDIHAVRLLYRNAHHETDNTNNLTVKAQVSTGSSGAAPFFPVFFRGSRSLVLEPGGWALSDPVHLGVAAGATFYVHTYQVAGTSQAGEKYIINHNTFLTGEFGNNTASDQTGTQLTTGSAGGLMPSYIFAAAPARGRLPMIGLIGDSIVDGRNDTNQEGWAARGVKGTYGYIGAGLSSETLSSFANAANSFKRRTFLQDVTAVLMQHGINDISAARTLVQMQTDHATVRTAARRAGASKIIASTLLPLTTSTDSWATTANQTVTANEGLRTAYNDWLRTVPSGIDYVFDAADVVEANSAGTLTRNGGRWGATFASAPIGGGGGADGVHPSIAGHAAIATAFASFLTANPGALGT